MSVTPETRRRTESAWRREPTPAVRPGSSVSRAPSTVAVWAVGVLIAGGVGGIVLNNALGGTGRHGISARGSALVASTAPVTGGVDDDISADEAPVIAPRAAFRPVQLSAPDDPFQVPTSLPAVAPAKPAVVAAAGAAGQAPVVSPPVVGKPARPAAPAAPAGPKADELNLTGIIQGDPAVAVVKYGGQSLFLKIGDQVADTWRLVEIKDRSVMFQLGEQRVEITIQGGNSQ